MTDDKDVAQIALTFPGTTENGSAFEVCGKGFAWFCREKIEGQKGRVERRDVLAVRVDGEQEKQALLASNTDKFFTTPHYNGYPAVLVRLAAIGRNELTELLTDAWRLRAPKKTVKEWEARFAVGIRPIS